MHEVESLPFTQDSASSAARLEDPAFRYQPNIICAACRELLTYARGLQHANHVTTRYPLADLRTSARLGCHLCAHFEMAFLGLRNPRQRLLADEPAAPWDITFGVLPREGRGGGAGASLPLFQCMPNTAIRQGRPDGVSMRGNVVLVYDGVDSGPVGSPEVEIPDWSRLSLGRSTGDEETFRTAREWLDRCLTTHALCAGDGDEARVVRPARLLSLAGEIRLVDSVEASGAEYVTLSHCWGRQTYIPKLEHKTEASFRAGIEFDMLPKTFQDAVQVTRKLGYRYIWIDSFCIIQDSEEDWKDQAKIMALVYVNSIFTIAALKSAGSSGGCFTNERNPLAIRPLHLEDLNITVNHGPIGSLWEEEVNTSGYGASPLHTRAWVVQERLSSPRTLSYGANGIYWECRCAQASESHYRTISWDDPGNKKTWLQKLEMRSATTETLPPEVPSQEISKAVSPRSSWQQHWIDLLKTYSSCELTMKTDKIVALTGLISEVERRSRAGDRCILGLWSHDLARMALWYRARDDINSPGDAVGRLDNGMPTWTWASVEGRCSSFAADDRVEWATTVEIDQAVAPALMTIHTWRRKVLIDENGDLVLDPDDPRSGTKGWGGDLDESYAWFADCDVPGPEVALHVVQVQRSRVIDTPPMWAALCLVVTPVADGSTVTGREAYQRVGVTKFRFSDKRDDPFKFRDMDAREVILLT